MSTSSRKPQLHLEARLNMTGGAYSRESLEREIKRKFEDHYTFEVTYQQTMSVDVLQAPEIEPYIERLQVDGITCEPGKENTIYEVKETDVIVHAYEIPPNQDEPSTFAFKSSKTTQAKIVNLPNESLMEFWEELEFDGDKGTSPHQILDSIVRTVTLLENFPKAMNINRLILIHGEPGCGKSSLCRALAQKVTIRFSHKFVGGKLFEINTQDLLSKYYSESGKLVLEMFDKVLDLAEDERYLIFVLIDEVESIAASRLHSMKSAECSDNMRATNQLLTALDRIRSKPNVIVFCTSNLLESIDTAFVDRVYDCIAVSPPGPPAIYTILSSTLNALIRAGAIKAEPFELDEEENQLPDLADDITQLPKYARLPTWKARFPEAVGPCLFRLAEKSVGLSGRRLRKLPLLAITKYTWSEKCTLREALQALEVAIVHECR